nr:ComEC/Rec2 family competence protein [Mycoplasma crocodyli]
MYFIIKYFNSNLLFNDGIYKVVYKDTIQYVVKNKYYKYIFYDSDNSYNVGDFLQIKAKSFRSSWQIKNYYLLSKRISGVIEYSKIDLVSNSWTLYKSLYEYSSNSSIYFQKYFMLLSLGYSNDISQEVYNQTKNLGILHIIVISGFHFSLIYKFLSYITLKLKIKFNELLCIFLIFIYYLLVNKNVSSNRAFFSIIFSYITSKFFKQKFKLIIPFFIGTIALIFNPFLLNSKGFWYTYVITFFIVLVNELKVKRFNKINKCFWYILLNFLIYLVSFQLGLAFNDSFNLIAFLNCLILIPLSQFLIINSIFLWFFKSYLSIIYKILDVLLEFLSYISYQIILSFRISYKLISIVIFNEIFMVYFLTFSKIKFKKEIKRLYN